MLLLSAQAYAAEELVVKTSRHGERFDVQARAVVAAPAALVWEVLTDYERLPQFIPGISRSVVSLRQRNRLLVDQGGEARFFIFSYAIRVRLEVLEQPPTRISSRAVGGNVRLMNGRYELHPGAAPGTVLLRYYGEIEPDFELPPLIGATALRRTVERQFGAMVAEIERRAGSGQAAK
jgi:ribosome-associated toxin RatA of RatAB toxin-antitoxin module